MRSPLKEMVPPASLTLDNGCQRASWRALDDHVSGRSRANPARAELRHACGYRDRPVTSNWQGQGCQAITSHTGWANILLRDKLQSKQVSYILNFSNV